MKKFLVTFNLMIDPTKDDSTFKQTYTVEAETKDEALRKAEALKDKEEPKISKRSVFSQTVKEIQ